MPSTSLAPRRPLHTVEEAAGVLRISRSKLYDLAREGRVPHRKIDGTGVRFSDADLDAIVEAYSRPAVR